MARKLIQGYGESYDKETIGSVCKCFFSFLEEVVTLTFKIRVPAGDRQEALRKVCENTDILLTRLSPEILVEKVPE